MGAHRRFALHGYNRNDPCCFAGDAIRDAEAAVSGALQSAGGGKFETAIDETNLQHAISETMIAHIMQRVSAHLAAGGTRD